MIGGSTGLVLLLGNPVGHSLSPVMHNAGFSERGLDLVYVACEVERTKLQLAVEGMKALGVLGCNVTVPYKEHVAGLIDERDEDVKATGAVNTVLIGDGSLTGYNTDVYGLCRGVSGRGYGGGCALILGAGGAARSAVWALKQLGCSEFVIANRNVDRARDVLDDLDAGGETISFDCCQVERAAREVAVIVNATASGVDCGDEGTDVIEKAIRSAVKNCVVVNYAYRSAPVYVDRLASEIGLKLVCGRELLLWQGVRSFELWTGEMAPVDVMRAAVGV